MKILLVDDDQAICFYVSNLLKKWGYEVIACHDGEQAWKILQTETINLVITDWMMPGLSGIELCEKIRSSSLSQYVYILLLTGRNQEEDLITGLSSGADDFITKPINPKELQVRIKAAQRIICLEQTLQQKNLDLSEANQQIQNSLVRIQNDLDSAAVLQRSLFPANNHTGLPINIAWEFQPADELAGDILGFYPLDDKNLGFYLLDVSGHGIPSAMISVYLHNKLANDWKGIRENTQNSILYYQEANSSIVKLMTII